MPKSKILLTIFISISMILISCSNDTSPNTTNKNKNKFNLGPNGLTMLDVIGSYDTTNNMGIILCTNFLHQPINPENDSLIMDESDNNAMAFFYNPDSTNQAYQCTGISVNNTVLMQIDSNDYTYTSAGDAFGGTGLQLHYGSGTNILHITGNINIPSLDTSFTLYNPIRITNLHRGDTIHTSQALTINWAGNSSDFVAINIITSNEVISPSGYLYTTNTITHDNGSYTFALNSYSQFPTGLYEIQITRWQPEIIQLSNGKKIAIIGEADHEISVFLIHD